MLARSTDNNTSSFVRILFAVLLGVSIVVISSMSLSVAGKQPGNNTSTTVQSSIPGRSCPACRPICGDQEVSTIEVWYRAPDMAPPGAQVPLELQIYALSTPHDIGTLTVTLPAGLGVDTRTLPTWLHHSGRSITWSPGILAAGDQVGVKFTATVSDTLAYGTELTSTVQLTLDGTQCSLPGQPVRAQFPRRRLALPVVDEANGFVALQNLEQAPVYPILLLWDSGAEAPSRLRWTPEPIEQGTSTTLPTFGGNAGFVYSVGPDQLHAAVEAASAALNDPAGWRTWELRWQAGEFGWGSALGAAIYLPGEDVAVYSALDAPLEPANDFVSYVLPAIDLQTASDIVLAVQNVGVAPATVTWEAWLATSAASPVTGTLMLPRGATSHISLVAHLGTEFQGAVHVHADSPLAVAAVSTDAGSQSVYTAQPTYGPRAPGTTLHGLTLSSSTWNTELWIHNAAPSDTTQTTVMFRNLAGNLVYETSRAIDPRGTWRIDVSSLPLPVGWVDWVEINGAATLDAITRLTHLETNHQADVEAFLWPPAGTQPAPRTWGLASVSGEGSLFIANPDDSDPLGTTPLWFDQNGLVDFICDILQGTQSSYYPSLHFDPRFRGSMILQARADLSAARGLTLLSVYLDPEGQPFAPTGLPYLPPWAAYPDLRCGLAGLVAPQWDIPMGQTRTFDLRLEDVADVTSLDVEVTFDPAILAIDDADPDAPGVQIQPGPAVDHTWVVTRNTVTDGTLMYTLGSREGGRPIHQAGSIGELAFSGQQPGESLVTTTVKAITISTPSVFSVKPFTITQRIRVSIPTATPTPTPTATSTPTPTSIPTPIPSPTPTQEPAYELYLPLLLLNSASVLTNAAVGSYGEEKGAANEPSLPQLATAVLHRAIDLNR